MKVLLLNYTFEVIHLVSERKALKLIYKNKAEIISDWQNTPFIYFGKVINLPSIIRLKYYIKKKYSKLSFSRKSVFKRDKYTCQYCFNLLKTGRATVDHIIPKCKGGESTFINCVAACLDCNSKKGNRTLDEANMELKTIPVAPAGWTHYISETDSWNDEWDKFLKYH